MTCPVCSANEIKNFLTVKEFNLVSCNSCEYTYIHPLPSEEFLNELYSNSEIDPYRISDDTKDQGITIKKLVKAIKKKCPKSGRILEVGCSSGHVLNELSKMEYECVGVDIFSDGIPSIQGVKFYNGTLHDQQFEDNYFDLIIMRNTLEHVRLPQDELLEINRVLKSGGVLYTKVPNFRFEKIHCFFNKDTYRSYYPPIHISHFSPKNFKLLLDKSGFIFQTWNIEKPHKRMQFLQNLFAQSIYFTCVSLRLISFSKLFPKVCLGCFSLKK